MRRGRPRNLHVEFSIILRDNAFENACSDWARDFAAVPRGALDHHSDDILRMVIRRETYKPRHVFFVPTLRGLRGASLSSDYHIFQTRSAARSAVFIDDFPQTFSHQFNLVGRNFAAQIGPHPRSL